MSDSIEITCILPARQRPALEQLIFFNVNQYRVRLGIQQSIETYGIPEIYELDERLCIRVGSIQGVQTLFALSAVGRPVGVAVFVYLPEGRFVVLHVGVASNGVLLKLMHEIRRAAHRTSGVDRIEVVYKKERQAVRLHV